MGYIIPMTPYIYDHYQQRMIKGKYRYHYIDRKPSISFREVIREKKTISSDLLLKKKRQNVMKTKKGSSRDVFLSKQMMSNMEEGQINIRI